MSAPINIGDPVTVLLHSGTVPHGFVQTRVELTYPLGNTWYWDGEIRAVGGACHGNERNENITWIRGHYPDGSPEAKALLASFALVGLDW